MRLRPPATLLVALFIALTGLTALVAWELHNQVSGTPLTPIMPRQLRLAEQPTSTAARSASADQISDWMATVLGRPLFDPERSPNRKTVEARTELARLTGVTISPTGKTAIFAGPAGGKPLILTEGARVGGYIIITIEAGGVTVVGPDGQRILHPTFEQGAPANGTGALPNVGRDHPKPQAATR